MRFITNLCLQMGISEAYLSCDNEIHDRGVIGVVAGRRMQAVNADGVDALEVQRRPSAADGRVPDKGRRVVNRQLGECTIRP